MLNFKSGIILLLSLFILSCQNESVGKTELKAPYLVVLGVAQDAGYPQAACQKSCCQKFHEKKESAKKVSCLGLVDQLNNQSWLLDATPDFPAQWQLIHNDLKTSTQPTGILLTHAHIGHYTGLMHLGREAMGADKVEVYAMPRMTKFLKGNGPWSQLVFLENILLNPIQPETKYTLNDHFSFEAISVPHRDEYSETVGYRVKGPNKSILFIPDIDKWERWDKDIVEEIAKVDYAFLDGTFFKNGELPNRDMSQIPHPFVEESMSIMENMPQEEKAKVYFIHFNHTNPLVLSQSPEKEELLKAGYQVAVEGMTFSL